jgi:hypothetical protein
MKNVAYRNLILAAAALAVCMTPAIAQTTTKLKAEIPFSFRAGGQQYPAGTYETSVMVSNTGSRVLKISNMADHNSSLVMANSILVPHARFRY